MRRDTDAVNLPLDHPSRRDILRWAGYGLGAVLAGPGLLEACAPGGSTATVSSHGGELTWGAAVLPTQLNPQSPAIQGEGAYVYQALYDFLLRRDKDFKLQPNLATSWNQVNDTTWQFKLRSDVKFHNGDTLTASDVKFSIERTYDPSAKSPYSGTYGSILQHFEVVDPTTLNMVTKAPDPLLPGRFAWFPAWILPEKYFNSVGPDGFNQKPVGSGPYILQEFVQGQRLVLAANKNYWRGKPNANTITMLPRPDDSARVAALQAGEVKLISLLPIDQIETLTANSKFKVVTNLDRSQFLIQPNTAIPPLDNKLVRQALSLAIDRQSISKNLFAGHVRPSTSVLIPGDDAFDAKAPVLPYDPSKARSLLSQAGYSGQPIIFEWGPSLATSLDPQINQALISMWKAVGLNIVSQQLDNATVRGKFVSKDFKGLFVSGVSSTLGDLDGSVWRAMMPGGTVRYWTNAEFDRLGVESHSAKDPAVRLKDHQRMVEIMLDEFPWIPVFQIIFAYATTKNVQFQPTSTETFQATSLSFS